MGSISKANGITTATTAVISAVSPQSNTALLRAIW